MIVWQLVVVEVPLIETEQQLVEEEEQKMMSVVVVVEVGLLIAFVWLQLVVVEVLQ